MSDRWDVHKRQSVHVGALQNRGITTLTASTTLSRDLHAGRTLRLGASGAALTFTLPTPTGSGDIYKFVVSVVNTSNYVIASAGSGVLRGMIDSLDADGTTLVSYVMTGAAGNDTITLNGTTSGGQIGDLIECEDILSGIYRVHGKIVVPAGSNVATPLS